MYAADVVIFAEPEQTELSSVKAILQCFGEASGLIANYAKSSIIPIQCDGIDTQHAGSVSALPGSVVPLHLSEAAPLGPEAAQRGPATCPRQTP
jgi:hypothetical protein